MIKAYLNRLAAQHKTTNQPYKNKRLGIALKIISGISFALILGPLIFVVISGFPKSHLELRCHFIFVNDHFWGSTKDFFTHPRAMGLW